MDLENSIKEQVGLQVVEGMKHLSIQLRKNITQVYDSTKEEISNRVLYTDYFLYFNPTWGFKSCTVMLLKKSRPFLFALMHSDDFQSGWPDLQKKNFPIYFFNHKDSETVIFF